MWNTPPLRVYLARIDLDAMDFFLDGYEGELGRPATYGRDDRGPYFEVLSDHWQATAKLMFHGSQ